MTLRERLESDQALLQQLEGKSLEHTLGVQLLQLRVALIVFWFELVECVRANTIVRAIARAVFG